VIFPLSLYSAERLLKGGQAEKLMHLSEMGVHFENVLLLQTFLIGRQRGRGNERGNVLYVGTFHPAADHGSIQRRNVSQRNDDLRLFSAEVTQKAQIVGRAVKRAREHVIDSRCFARKFEKEVIALRRNPKLATIPIIRILVIDIQSYDGLVEFVSYFADA